tara:strand:- start:2183 stop:3280 length:1098 start_codon:yes stop_codon:yes gene_type:complete
MPTVTSTQIWVKQDDLNQTQVVEHVLSTDTLGEGEVLLEMDSFGFSANNITYAALGFNMGYWGFFPAAEGYGIVPVWGFATVVASNHSGVNVNEKVFGYLPMASHWIIKAGKVASHGFSDIHENRKSISPVYDQYLRCANDPGYDANREAWQLNFRPLYMTSFVLDDFVDESSQGESLLLSSASSKTALGTAQLLKDQKAQRGANYQVIGLTSTSNVEMVKTTGCYDLVVSYSDINTLSDNQQYWLLDFAANGSLIGALGDALGNTLSKITLIGATDWKAEKKPNKKALDAEIFFAPARVKLRQQTWGHDAFLLRYAKAWQGFANKIQDTFYQQNHTGAQQITSLYLNTLNGNADTKALNVVRFN